MGLFLFVCVSNGTFSGLELHWRKTCFSFCWSNSSNLAYWPTCPCTLTLSFWFLLYYVFVLTKLILDKIKFMYNEWFMFSLLDLVVVIDNYEFCLNKKSLFFFFFGLCWWRYEDGDEDDEENEGRWWRELKKKNWWWWCIVDIAFSGKKIQTV